MQRSSSTTNTLAMRPKHMSSQKPFHMPRSMSPRQPMSVVAVGVVVDHVAIYDLARGVVALHSLTR